MFEDNAPQAITQFTSERVPVSLGVLLDVSDSMRGQPIVDARAAVDRFVGDLLEAGDEAFIASFNHVPTLVQFWTRPASTLRGQLDSLQPWGSTAIYDALVASAFLFNSREHARAALLVISDGSDTASDLTLLQTRDILRRADPFVYALAIDSRESACQRPGESRRAARHHGAERWVYGSGEGCRGARGGDCADCQRAQSSVPARLRVHAAARRELEGDSGAHEERRALHARASRLLRGALAELTQRAGVAGGHHGSHAV